MNRYKKALIIGGGGFIGSNIAKYLMLNRDYTIDIVDNFSRSSSHEIPLLKEFNGSDRIKIHNVDLTIPESFDILDDNYDYVYMLAAMVGVDKVNAVPHDVIRVNSLLVINALEWLKRVSCKRVVFSSTSETYAGTIEAFGYNVPTNEDVPLTIEDIGHSRFTYAITKMLGESGFINYAKQGFFDAVVVRYHNVYGPMMGFRHVIPHLVERFQNKEEPFLIYGHDQTRSFNYIGDAVEGTVLSVEKGRNLEVYHIGDDDEISIETLTKFVGKKLNFSGKYEYAPTFPGSVSRRCPDISKAKKDLSYEPKIDWRNGIDKTVDWYLDYLESAESSSESFYDQYGIKK
jgi:nucleoside-diphosphate-sugar epimerase